jgi:flagellar biosynthesis protein FliR
MKGLELGVVAWLLAALRFTPVLMMPALTPFTWAPLHVRAVLLLALAWLLTGIATPVAMPDKLALAACGELLVGVCYGLAVMLPMAALGFSARVLDAQAGLASASLFNPALQGVDSLLGSALALGATFVFFALGFHLLLLRYLAASVRWVPLGAAAHAPSLSALLSLLGNQFIVGLMVVLPAVLGLFAVDIAVAFASRSMPQANIYFLALPLKVAAVLLLLAGSLRLAPGLLSQLFENGLLGAQSMVRG